MLAAAASPAASPSPEAAPPSGGGIGYHTSPGINVSVSVLVGGCFLLGLFAGAVRIRGQQRQHRVSKTICIVTSLFAVSMYTTHLVISPYTCEAMSYFHHWHVSHCIHKHTSPGVSLSVSVLVGSCFLPGLFAGFICIPGQQR